MRVVGGIWRGRTIAAPEGRDTRPTTDRVRESAASSVLSLFDLSLEGVRVLDAFAGSGAFGIEMLSRGAQSCTFLDTDKRALQTLKRNLASLGAGSAATVLALDAFKSPSALAGRNACFDLVLLDPPYAFDANDLSELVAGLFSAGCIAEDGIVVYERAANAPSLSVLCAEELRSKRLGETALDYFRIGATHGA